MCGVEVADQFVVDISCLKVTLGNFDLMIEVSGIHNSN